MVAKSERTDTDQQESQETGPVLDVIFERVGFEGWEVIIDDTNEAGFHYVFASGGADAECVTQGFLLKMRVLGKPNIITQDVTSDRTKPGVVRVNLNQKADRNIDVIVQASKGTKFNVRDNGTAHDFMVSVVMKEDCDTCPIQGDCPNEEFVRELRAEAKAKGISLSTIGQQGEGLAGALVRAAGYPDDAVVIGPFTFGSAGEDDESEEES